MNLCRRMLLQTWLALAAVSCGTPGDWLAAKAASGRGVKWVVFYGEAADEQVISTYDLGILDPTFQGSLSAISQHGTRLCGYLSIGEIRTADMFYRQVDPACLLEANPSWPSTRRIDVRHPSWHKLVLDSIIPSIAARGFTGLLLDTLDTPPYLEQLDPDGGRGMRDAAAAIVHDIRKRYSDMLILMNRGYALLPGVAGSVDGIVAESLLTMPGEGEEGGYRWNEPSAVAQQLQILAKLPRRRTRLPILSLDYWYPDDPTGITEIYLRERELGHHPYVGTRTLDRVVGKPGLATV